MTGSDEMKAQEYAALMQQARDSGRTSQLCWTGAAVAAAVLLSGAISAKSPGLMLPVQLCTALGFYATLHARGQTRLIEGYLREFHEKDGNGPQWHSRVAHVRAMPGSQERTDWLPLALANAAMIATVVFGWVFAQGAAHGELMAGMCTMAGVAFAVHSLVEHMRLEQAQDAAAWGQGSGGLREVTGYGRAASGR